MIILSDITVIIFIAAILILDVAVQFIGGIVGKILSIVNLCLHISLIFPMMTIKTPMAEAVLVYMLSTFVYTLVFFVRHNIESVKAKKAEEGENDI